MSNYHKLPDEGKMELITGGLGGGKTAYAAELGYCQLQRGGWWFHNLELDLDEIERRLRDEDGLEFIRERCVKLAGETMSEFHKQLRRGAPGEPVMTTIDEAHFDFDTADARNIERDTIAFASLARKLHIHLVFITHDGDDIAIKIRKKFAVETVCRNLKDEKFCGLAFPIQMYGRVSFALRKGRAHHKIEHDWVRSPSSWGIYDSYALLGHMASQFGSLEVARSTRLRKIPRPSFAPYALAATAATIATLLPS